MSGCKHRLPGFKASCLAFGALYVLLGARILLRGIPTSMAEYAVPEVTLQSPHYQDAILWVYLHTIVLGMITVVVGLVAVEDRVKRWFARAFLAAHICYTYLDARSSESFFGNGLYRGPGSVVPAIFCVVATIFFAHVAFCAPSRSPSAVA